MLAFDVDGGEGSAAWIDAGLPEPNIIVRHRSGSHDRAHLVYQLANGVSHANRRAFRYLESIRRAYTAQLLPHGGDASYAGRTIHSPWAVQYEAAKGSRPSYELAELATYADFNEPLPAALRRKNPTRVNAKVQDPREVAIGERNDALFDAVRFSAYRLWRIHGDTHEFESAVDEVAGAWNAQLREPLPEAEVGDTVTSIVRWCRRRYTGRVTHGLTTIGVDASRNRARSEARKALRAAEGRSRGDYLAPTRERLLEALRRRDAGETARAIADALGVCVRTVRRYFAMALQLVTGSARHQGCEGLSSATDCTSPGPARPKGADISAVVPIKAGSERRDRRRDQNGRAEAAQTEPDLVNREDAQADVIDLLTYAQRVLPPVKPAGAIVPPDSGRSGLTGIAWIRRRCRELGRVSRDRDSSR